ncbi:MAG: large conductance mechanosensitive channel protein MscL [Gammaproteobacteria bacterium]|nr:large conductance mechanosensitive channel protein MscL [Gammaproteobacteria bacterium]
MTEPVIHLFEMVDVEHCQREAAFVTVRMGHFLSQSPLKSRAVVGSGVASWLLSSRNVSAKNIVLGVTRLAHGGLRLCLGTAKDAGEPAMLKEFYAFIARGNVVDLAVVVIIGAAFTGIVDSIVHDLMTQALGRLGDRNFSDLYLVLKGSVPRGTSYEAAKGMALVFGYGAFLTALINFLLIGLVVFGIVQAINRVYRKQAARAGGGPCGNPIRIVAQGKSGSPEATPSLTSAVPEGYPESGVGERRRGGLACVFMAVNCTEGFMERLSKEGMLLVVLIAWLAPSLAQDAFVRIDAPEEGAMLDAMEQHQLVYEVQPGPRGNHVHLYVNDDEVAILRELQGRHTLETLPPGTHDICVKVVNRGHVPIGVEDCVKATVQ